MPKQPEPIAVDTLDQKLLYDLLHEHQEQTRILKSLNRTVQIWSALAVIGIILFIIIQIL